MAGIGPYSLGIYFYVNSAQQKLPRYLALVCAGGKLLPLYLNADLRDLTRAVTR
jgi:hypothetical protein